MKTAAPQVLSAFEDAFGGQLPVRVQCWDGSAAGPRDADVTVHFRRRRALRRILWSPGELGLGRAWVSGDLDIDGDPFALLDGTDLVDRMVHADHRAYDRGAAVHHVATLLRLGALGPPPRPPDVEIRRRHGLRHSVDRDATVVSHHYDVGNDFYRLLLGPSMVYSCAYWARDPQGAGAGGTQAPGAGGTLEDAQFDKLDLVCRKLGVGPGTRLLDVGCGWGAMAVHAAREHGAHVVGVTISHEQADHARAAVHAAGLDDRVEIRLQDYRDVDDGPYDAISSIGMSEHVGAARIDEYAARLYALLRPGGRLLNHAIAALAPPAPHRGPTFIDRYVFPDGELLPLSRVLTALERTGFETRDCESLREHYSRTLRCWVANLQASWDDAVTLVGAERARTWLLYLVASAVSFDRARIAVNQVLAVRADEHGGSGMPPTRSEWLGA